MSAWVENLWSYLPVALFIVRLPAHPGFFWAYPLDLVLVFLGLELLFFCGLSTLDFPFPSSHLARGWRHVPGLDATLNE